jgi:hypothetical protein
VVVVQGVVVGQGVVVAGGRQHNLMEHPSIASHMVFSGIAIVPNGSGQTKLVQVSGAVVIATVVVGHGVVVVAVVVGHGVVVVAGKVVGIKQHAL